MLFTGLQGQGETRLAIQIHGAANQPPRHLPHQFLPTAQKTEIGSARGQRRSQWLTVAASNVGTGRAPVSYTHLDVYKRQAIRLSENLP